MVGLYVRGASRFSAVLFNSGKVAAMDKGDHEGRKKYVKHKEAVNPDEVIGDVLGQLPVYGRGVQYDAMKPEERQKLIDQKTGDLAMMLAMYPFTDTNKLAEEFGMSATTVKLYATRAGIKKKESRGGHNRKTIEALNMDGYVVAVFHSTAEAAEAYGVSPETIARQCKGMRTKHVIAGIGLRYR